MRPKFISEPVPDDPWLSEQVREFADLSGDYSGLVAVGMLVRLRMWPSNEVRAIVQSVLKGEAHPSLLREREWFRSLSPREKEEALRVARIEIDLIHERLEEILESPDPEDEGWVQSALSVCRARDDLEGVVLLLDSAGLSAQLAYALRSLDSHGEEVMWSIPELPMGHDEKLSRGLLASPGAWWVDF